MLRDILHTIGSRYIVALLGFALILINAKVLGVEGVGLVGLIWASINIIITINSVLSNNTIVYFCNKYPVRVIYPISFLWIFVGTGIGCGVLWLLGLLPSGYGWDIYFITILYSMGVMHSRFLLAKDRIDSFNLVNIIQGGMLFFVLIYFYYALGRKEVSSYILGLYITQGLAAVLSVFILLAVVRKAAPAKPSEKPPLRVLKEMFAYGLWGSADNIAETCTARLNYFLVERFAGLASVGLLDVGTKVSESVWNISKSVAFIEYNRVAKEPDCEVQRRITIQLLKLTFFVITTLMACILLIPEWVYTEYLLSPDFSGIRKVITALGIGIITLGCNTIVVSFFIASGKIKYSAFSSCIGLAVLLAGGSVLIPAYGVTGSAISTSIAFTSMLAYSLIVFKKITATSFKEFLPSKEDWRVVKGYFHHCPE